jgi:hypothetical protein
MPLAELDIQYHHGASGGNLVHGRAEAATSELNTLSPETDLALKIGLVENDALRRRLDNAAEVVLEENWPGRTESIRGYFFNKRQWTALGFESKEDALALYRQVLKNKVVPVVDEISPTGYGRARYIGIDGMMAFVSVALTKRIMKVTWGLDLPMPEVVLQAQTLLGPKHPWSVLLQGQKTDGEGDNGAEPRNKRVASTDKGSVEKPMQIEIVVDEGVPPSLDASIRNSLDILELGEQEARAQAEEERERNRTEIEAQLAVAQQESEARRLKDLQRQQEEVEAVRRKISEEERERLLAYSDDQIRTFSQSGAVRIGHIIRDVQRYGVNFIIRGQIPETEVMVILAFHEVLRASREGRQPLFKPVTGYTTKEVGEAAEQVRRHMARGVFRSLGDAYKLLRAHLGGSKS